MSQLKSDLKMLRHKQEFKQAGTVLAEAVLEITNGPVYDNSVSEEVASVDYQMAAADLTAGLMSGAAGIVNIDAIAPCFLNAEDFVSDVDDAFEMISFHTWNGLYDGALLLGEALVYLPEHMSECSSDLSDLKAWTA